MKTQGDIARLLLRLSLGLMMLLHGISKVQHGVGSIIDMVTSHGLPAVLGYGVLVGEIIAPLMVVLGLQSRLGGWLITINMIFAILLVHSGELLSLSKHGGWAIELQMFYLICGAVVGLLGSGKYALKPD